MPWYRSRVCTQCNRIFSAPDTSMRQLCSRCIKYSHLRGVTRSAPTRRDTYLMRTYNMTAQEYAHMLKIQGGKCLICGRPPRRGTRLHVDHDHTALTVRGLLCTGCNTRLGWLEAHKAAIDIYMRNRGSR